MWTKDAVFLIVENFLKSHEKLGDCGGESGHLAYVSLNILKISEPKQITPLEWEINFEFLLTIETEFTYEPDNPAYKYKYKQQIIIDKNGSILRFKAKSYI